MANFYRHFIQDYAKVAWPPNDLTKKDEPFVWKAAQQKAFNKLKMLFITAPVLAFPDKDCQFHLESDASEFATGAVLSMLKEDKWNPVTYNSHSMSSEESIRIASSDQVQRQQQRDEPVRKNTYLVLDTLASRLRELSLDCRS